MTNRTVIVALDFPNPELALQFIQKLPADACALKVGFELFLAGGPKFVESLVSKGFKVFLDLKFHDIPNTVASACSVAAKMGVWMINVHASGGQEMMLAAREALDRETLSDQPKLIAVTVLTSMNQDALSLVGISGDVHQVVSHWATLAMQSGLDGVVSSAQEAELIRKKTSQEFLIVTPGIRLLDDSNNDQKRVVTPQDAKQSGVSHIVVGRPITRASDPSSALQKFCDAFCA